MASKFAIGTLVIGSKGKGTITAIITKSTGYVQVTYLTGEVKKEMAFNLKNEQGESLKATPKAPKQGSAASHAAWKREFEMNQLRGSFLDCQIANNSYNPELIGR